MAYQGTQFDEIDDNLKERFLEFVANGYTRQEAAAAVNASPRQLRACCSPKSHRYDPKFAKEYAKLTEKNGEHEEGIVDRLRDATLQRALRSSDPLLIKLNMIYDPAWEIHRPQAMQINFNADKMAVMLPGLSTETLERMKQELEQKKQGELPPGPPDIDAA